MFSWIRIWDAAVDESVEFSNKQLPVFFPFMCGRQLRSQKQLVFLCPSNLKQTLTRKVKLNLHEKKFMMLKTDLEGFASLEPSRNQSVLAHLGSPHVRERGHVEIGCHRQSLRGSLKWPPPSLHLSERNGAPPPCRLLKPTKGDLSLAKSDMQTYKVTKL